VKELEASHTLKLCVALGLRLRVLPVIAPEVESDVFARSRPCESDEHLSAAASHVEEPAIVPDRVDQELMNPALEVAPTWPKKMRRPGENDGDVQERHSKEGNGKSRKPEERHERGENKDPDCHQPKCDNSA
jgi:hypothetical protein